MKNGGGWDYELEGIWFGKFEAVKNTSDTSVKVVAGESSWTNLVINEMYNYGLTATYGGSNNSSNILQSHMIKNSEWGSVTYLAHSQFGLNGGKVSQNTSSSYFTGGNNAITTVYDTDVCQNTTHNKYGVFDLNGGAYEYVASYVNNGHTNLPSKGNYNSNLEYKLFGNAPIDGETDERCTSTKYKTVYLSTSKDGSDTQHLDYFINSWIRGDVVFEISNSYTGKNSWYLAFSYFPCISNPFFIRGGNWNETDAPGCFYFHNGSGASVEYRCFRVALCY